MHRENAVILRTCLHSLVTNLNKMSAVSTSARNKKSDPLAKKTPSNPKYEHIGPCVDTGSSVNRYLAKIEECRRNFKIKDNEIFKRMKVTTFVQLLLQVKDYERSLRNETPRDDGESTERSTYRPDTADREVQKIQGGKNSYRDTPGGDTNRSDNRSSLQQVIKGVGEVDIYAGDKPQPRPPVIDNTCPYLLLDVRLLEDFNQCHIITAKSYPTAMLSRAHNFETKEMLAYKNQPGKIIVIYDDDERIAPAAATTLVQREYDNLFLLSGGMRLAYKVFNEHVITGTPNTIMTDGKTVQSMGPATKLDFDDTDVHFLEQKLDSALDDKRIGSRLSNASTASRRAGSKMSTKPDSSMSGQITGRAPFKP